jgi:cytochrome c553
MMRLPRWIRYLLGSLVAVVVLVPVVLYLRSEQVVRHRYPMPKARTDLPIPADSASLAEGRRLASVHGCPSCHGEQLQGTVLFDEPHVGRLIAPNLTRTVRNYSTAELEQIIRHGVRPNGRSVWAMPSDMLHGLGDDDLGRIIAFLRSQPEVDGLAPSLTLGPLGRLGIVLGQFHPVAQLVDTAPPPREAPTANDSSFGRYLARTSCTECHGGDLLGDPAANPSPTPSLALAVGYTSQEFREFMQRGVAKGQRELPMMSQLARLRFSQFTEPEIVALYGYLRTLTPGPAPAP